MDGPTAQTNPCSGESAEQILVHIPQWNGPTFAKLHATPIAPVPFPNMDHQSQSLGRNHGLPAVTFRPHPSHPSGFLFSFVSFSTILSHAIPLLQRLAKTEDIDNQSSIRTNLQSWLTRDPSCTPSQCLTSTTRTLFTTPMLLP